MTRVKVAELTSGIGALVLGVGIGAMFPRWFAPSAALIAAAGVIAHAFGMWDKHRLEAQSHADGGTWIAALYWACWFLLAAVIVLLFVRH
jgi:hypothetical protein